MNPRLPEPLLADAMLAGTRLLHVERHGPRALSLRFDRIELHVLVEDGGIELELGGGSPLSPTAEALDETDPWWTLIGQPLMGAWSQLDTDQRRLVLELQFRPDDENPKILSLEPHGPRIRARAVPKSTWDGAA